MKLHYSQTGHYGRQVCLIVSVPYEITLLSNPGTGLSYTTSVSVPYEITLLSNPSRHGNGCGRVSVPYEITLLSNLK